MDLQLHQLRLLINNIIDHMFYDSAVINEYE